VGKTGIQRARVTKNRNQGKNEGERQNACTKKRKGGGGKQGCQLCTRKKNWRMEDATALFSQMMVITCEYIPKCREKGGGKGVGKGNWVE